jgi:hypothetical protein
MPETVFQGNKMYAITNPNQIATFINAELGIAALVTKISKGYAVTLWDTDAEQPVDIVRIFGSAMLDPAINYAKSLVVVPA